MYKSKFKPMTYNKIIKKGEKTWIAIKVFLALVATYIIWFVVFGIICLSANSCDKQNVERGEDCLCSPEAQKTNSDFCKQICSPFIPGEPI